jgi:hypothetical protein
MSVSLICWQATAAFHDTLATKHDTLATKHDSLATKHASLATKHDTPAIYSRAHEAFVCSD